MKKARKKTLNYILLTVAAVSFVVLLFNVQFLGLKQGENIEWKMPLRAIENDEGMMCVVDDNWSKLTILNPDKTIRATIVSDFGSTILPDMISDVAMDSSCVYFTDIVLSANGTSAKAERVLKFNLDGEYVATLYTDSCVNANNLAAISVVKVFRDTVYLVKSAGDSVTVIALVDSTERVIRKCRFGGNDIRYATYQPEIDVVCANTMNGLSYVAREGRVEKVSTDDTTAYISSVVEMPDRSRYILDANNGVLIYQNSNGEERKLCRTDAMYICCNAHKGRVEHIFLCDQSESTVTSISLNDHKQNVLRSAEWPRRHITLWIVTLVCAALVVLVLLYYIISFMVFAIRRQMSGREEEERMKNDGVLSPSALYGKPALFIVAAFAVTGALVSMAYYRDTIEIAKKNTQNLANAISTVSGQTIGDKIKHLDSADDFGNDNYRDVHDFCSALCEERTGEGFDLLFDIFRIDSISGDLVFVFDHSTMNLLGTPVPQKRLVRQGADAAVDAVRAGEQKLFTIRSDIGPGFVAALAPIYDHQQSVVGVIVVINDLDAISSHARENILSILLRAFTLLTVLLMLYAEIKLLVEFVKLRRERNAAAGHRVTFCEGHRTIRIFSRIPFYMLVPFIAPYSRELAAESSLGYDTGMLAAIPMSLYGLVMAVGTMFVGFAVNRNPRRSMDVANLIYIVSALTLLANHMYIRSYSLLVAIFVLMGIAAAITITSVKGMRLRDMKPAKRYGKLVFNNMEPPIYASVGAAVGALLYDSMGIGAVVTAICVVCLACMLISHLFMADDLNQEVADKNAAIKGAARSNLRYFMRWDVLVCLLCVCIPASFVNQYTSFMLPMINENLGYTVLVVAFLTLITKLLPILISPNLTAALVEKNFAISSGIALGSIALMMFVFAMKPTMICFALLLLVLGTFFPVLTNLSEKFQVDSARSAGVKAEDVNGAFAMCVSVGDFAGPVCLAAMMAIGNSAVGWISGGACIVCIILLLITRKSPVIC